MLHRVEEVADEEEEEVVVVVVVEDACHDSSNKILSCSNSKSHIFM
jgi:hypothetical protein